MKNKFSRLIRLGTVTVLLVPILALAAYNDVTLNSGSTLGLSVAGSNLNFSAVDGLVQDVTVNASNVAFTMLGGSTVTVSSTDKKTFTYDAGRAVAVFTCGDSASTISFSLAASEASQSLTLTPTGSTCSSSSSGSGGGGSGGGGESTSGTTSTTATTETTSTTAVSAPAAATTVASAPTVSSVPAAAVAQPSPVAQLVSPVFNSDLVIGSKGDDVTKLQEVLAKDSEIYPEGLVTGYFGPATQRAVKRFQAKNGLPQVGRVGPATRAKLNEAAGVPAAAVAQPSPVAQLVSPVFNSDLVIGSKGDDVTKLQELLAKDKDVYPEGLVTGTFGPATQRAVKRFQAKNGLPQVGRVGPATRAKLNEMGGSQPQSNAPVPVASAPEVSSAEQKALNDQLKALQDQLNELLKKAY